MASLRTLYLTLFLVAILHSFTALAFRDPQITPAPTPTQARRDVAGAPGTPILSTLKYDYTALPQQVYPFPVLRGPQFGYNVCNSRTFGNTSNCQTLIFNGPDDFCLWGSPVAGGTIGYTEARVVAYCTKPYHGTRLIPPGAITGLQWTKTAAYIQVTGFISNSGLGLAANDTGGELDPHGADLQGNPLGGVVYSNGTADSVDGHTLAQVMNWNVFVGGNLFCAKICFNSITTPNYCQNTYDLIGCAYNMPSNARDREFTSCDGDLQDEVGVYTLNGQVMKYIMPATLTAPPPYQPRVPASSNCKTYHSTDLFMSATGTWSTSRLLLPTSRTSTTSYRPSVTGANAASKTLQASAAPIVHLPHALSFALCGVTLYFVWGFDLPLW